MDEENTVYTYNSKVFSLRKREDLLAHVTTRVDLEDMVLHDMHQSQKDKCYLVQRV